MTMFTATAAVDIYCVRHIHCVPQKRPHFGFFMAYFTIYRRYFVNLVSVLMFSGSLFSALSGRHRAAYFLQSDALRPALSF